MHRSELEPELNGDGARAKRGLHLSEVCTGDEVTDGAALVLAAAFQVESVEQVIELGANLKLRAFSQGPRVGQSECLG